MKKAILGALFLSAFSVAQASAVTIDFSNNVWNPGLSDSKTVGNTTVSSVPGIPLGVLNWCHVRSGARPERGSPDGWCWVQVS